MTKTNVSTPPMDIQRSKLIAIVVVDYKFGNTFHGLYDDLRKHLFHKRKTRRKHNMGALTQY
jgi:hypothetical protein